MQNESNFIRNIALCFPTLVIYFRIRIKKLHRRRFVMLTPFCKSVTGFHSDLDISRLKTKNVGTRCRKFEWVGISLKSVNWIYNVLAASDILSRGHLLFLGKGEGHATNKYRSRCYIWIKMIIICDNFPFFELCYQIVK